MNKHFFIPQLLVFGIGCLLVSESCTRSSGCPDIPDRTYTLNDTDKNLVPYSGTDTMTFTNGLGKTVKLYGIGKISGLDAHVIKGAEPMECRQPVINYGFQRITYLSNDTIFLGEIDFRLERAQSPNYYGSTVSWLINGAESYTYDFHTLLNDSAYFDTVYVSGTLFQCIKITADTGDVSNVLYYNHHFGILKMIFPPDQTWYKQ
jgi:hypothetical protein